MNNIPKTPLLFMIVGFITGVIITRNSVAMAKPERGTAYIAMAAACFLLYRMATKGKNQAIASAVAVAVAKANAEASAAADARAQAVAQQAVAVYIGATERGNDYSHAEILDQTLKSFDVVTDTSGIIESHSQKGTQRDTPNQRQPRRLQGSRHQR